MLRRLGLAIVEKRLGEGAELHRHGNLIFGAVVVELLRVVSGLERGRLLALAPGKGRS